MTDENNDKKRYKTDTCAIDSPRTDFGDKEVIAHYQSGLMGILRMMNEWQNYIHEHPQHSWYTRVAIQTTRWALAKLGIATALVSRAKGELPIGVPLPDNRLVKGKDKWGWEVCAERSQLRLWPSGTPEEKDYLASGPLEVARPVDPEKEW